MSVTQNPNLKPNNSVQAESLFDPTVGSGAGQISFDPTPLKATEEQKKFIIDYIKLRMGDGMVDVDASRDHYEMGITQALMRYRQRSSNSVEESYAFLDLTPETQEYILPKEIMNIRAIYRRGISSLTGTSTNMFEPFASGYLNTYMLNTGRVGGLVNYELFAGYQELTMKMFGGYIQFSFNKVTKKLVISRKTPFQGPDYKEGHSESVLLHVDNYKPDQMLLADSSALPWLQDYALAFVMIAEGNAREKFGTIAGPQGGTTLNGAQLKAEGQAILDRLDQELKNYVDGGMGLTWIIG
jgi:hypothetical protein